MFCNNSRWNTIISSSGIPSTNLYSSKVYLDFSAFDSWASTTSIISGIKFLNDIAGPALCLADAGLAIGLADAGLATGLADALATGLSTGLGIALLAINFFGGVKSYLTGAGLADAGLANTLNFAEATSSAFFFNSFNAFLNSFPVLSVISNNIKI